VLLCTNLLYEGRTSPMDKTSRHCIGFGKRCRWISLAVLASARDQRSAGVPSARCKEERNASL